MPSSARDPGYDRVASEIHELLRQGTWTIGERLPSERALALRFGVSRNCVREALRALAERGLLLTRRGAGTYVAEPREQIALDAMARVLGARRDRLRDLFELRLILEPAIASLAAQHLSEDHLRHLKAIVLDQHRRVAEGKSDADLDTAFHEALAAACGNTVVRDLMQSLRTALHDTRSADLRPRDRRKASVQAHLDILAALERRDPNDARKAMVRHVTSMQHLVLGKEG
jgi:GntR family transcriptional repressor for pyruvate dehydrogenase complex